MGNPGGAGARVGAAASAGIGGQAPLRPVRAHARGRRVALVAALGALALGGCELDEVSIARPEAVVVAEAYLLVGDGPDQVSVFLHSTLSSLDVPRLLAATVRLVASDTADLTLDRYPNAECLLSATAQAVSGACFAGGPEAEGVFRPGDRVELEITLPDGRELRGATTIPEDIRLLRPRNVAVCALPPGRNLTLMWNRSPGAWAYSAETAIWGLRSALAPQGVEVEADSVALLGLAVSESDTTIAYPSEFGVFSRFDLEREVAQALQEGLPRGTQSVVSVAALDRNYVNWVRGGNFNPSGTVRVPSLRGDGTGVLGSAVRRTVRVIGGDPFLMPGQVIPSCFTGS